MENIQVLDEIVRKRRFSDEEKRAFVAEIKASSLIRVARKHGIAQSVLHTWKKKFGRSAFAVVKVAPSTELSKPQPVAPLPTIKVHLSAHCLLEFPPEISPSFLAEFIKDLKVLS